MPSSPDAVSSLPHQDIVNKVFGIPLIVKRICFYSLLESKKELLQLRLLNRLFQEEATKELLGNPAKYSIELCKEFKMKEFLDLMQRRQEVLGMRPLFPFSSFTLHPYWGSDWNFDWVWDSGLIQTFSKMSAGHVRRLHFDVNAKTIENVLTILSHSPHLVQITANYEGPTLSPLTPEQLARLPTTLRQLRDLNLEYGGTKDLEIEVGNELCPLFEVLIRRAPGLERVRVPVLDTDEISFSFIFPSPDIPDTRILRLLVETHSRKLPLLSCDDAIGITPGLPALTECMELNFRFWEIDISMQNWNFTDLEFSNMKQGFLAWLELQSATLTSLRLQSAEPALTLPPLPSLQKLHVIGQWTSQIEALDPNRYPSLHKLSISVRGDDDAGKMSTGPMGSVQVLDLYSTARFTDPAWSQTFPNLTSLHFRFDGSSDENAESSITFILTHFPALVHLSIRSVSGQNTKLCLWNILTGAAPRPTPNTAHLNINIQGVPTFPPEEPPTGIYQIPSLGNMRALKTLELGPIKTQGTLDAIMYMTCTGLLGPLHEIRLWIDKELLFVEAEREDYCRRLARVHEKLRLF